MAQTYIGTVHTTTGLTIRSGPGTEYSIATDELVQDGDQLFIYDTQINGMSIWGNIGTGWICVSNNGNRYVDLQLPPKVSTMAETYGPNQIIQWDDSENLYFSSSEFPLSSGIATNPVAVNSRQYVIDSSMRLFGLPYQFNAAADPRYTSCNSIVGREFAQKFFSDGAIAYIIPGKASFMPGVKGAKRKNTGLALITASTTDFKALQEKIGDMGSNTELRFYDFQEDYTSYMHYVNAMCRTVATFLELDTKIDNGDGSTWTFQKFDWRNYRWTSKEYNSAGANFLGAVGRGIARIPGIISNIFLGGEDNTASGNQKEISFDSGGGEDDLNLNQLGGSQNYVMFYVDPSIDGNESASNNIGNSMIQDTLDQIHSRTNEFGFILNSASAGTVAENIGESASSLVAGAMDGISSAGAVGNIFSKILDLGASVIQGDNVIVPKIYQNSDYSRSYSITCHLRAPYGDKLSVYIDVLVPMLHLLALALPKQTTANTYGSPFLIKMYIPGIINCGLGIVSSIQISKSQNEDSRSIDGLPMEVDVTLQIEDLYSRLTMSPTTDPLLFVNNSSLIEYLATISGLNLITPQLGKKLELLSSTIANSITDIPGNVAALGSDFIDRMFASLMSL